MALPTDSWDRFLRSTGLDELPQLWNVLRGQMSRFGRQLPRYGERLRFHPGITGWAQVHGWRGDTSIRSRVECDLHYLRHWSLALDFRILWMTGADLLRRLRRAAASRETPDARSA